MMFNENDCKWIRYYKTFTIIMFWLFIAATAVMAILGWCGEFWIIDAGFLDGIVFLASGLVVAYGHLICNMLIIQLLNNVQVIREKLATQNPDKTANTNLDELKKFKKLLDMGVLTQEEYDSKKAQLLKEI